jgi:hypothetical protein
MASSTVPWGPIVTRQLTSAHVDAVASAEAPYVRIPQIISLDWCAEISQRFLDFIRAHPNCRRQLRTFTMDSVVEAIDFFMGPDTGGEPRMDEYFSLVPRDAPRLREIYRGGPDPMTLFREQWRSAGWIDRAASENGRPFHTDVLWGTIGSGQAPKHVDSYHLDFECALSRFPRRFSWNLYVQPPEAGGTFRVFRERRGVQGFDGHPLDGAQADYEIAPGDLVIFDAGNFHEILATRGERHRLVAHSAVLFDPATRDSAFVS